MEEQQVRFAEQLPQDIEFALQNRHDAVRLELGGQRDSLLNVSVEGCIRAHASAGIVGRYTKGVLMSKVKREWQGTTQHGNSSDLSRWLVHLTHSEEDLIAIPKTGMIEARLPYGAGRTYSIVRDRHRSVCLTEIPLHELGRMTTKRPWGIVFDKERLRAKFNAQPVWYISDPSPQWNALGVAMHEAKGNLASPIWQLTPFIERVRSR